MRGLFFMRLVKKLNRINIDERNVAPIFIGIPLRFTRDNAQSYIASQKILVNRCNLQHIRW